MSTLFRKEAIEQRTKRFHGAVVLARPWSFTALTAFFMLIIALLLVFAFAFGFTRKETINGMVVPDQGMIRIGAPQPGTVSKVLVKEGQQVKAGDPLFFLSGERATKQGASQEAINESLLARIEALRKEMAQQDLQSSNKSLELRQELESLTSSLKLHELDLVVLRRKLALLDDVAGRFQELAKTGAVPASIADEKAVARLEQASRIHAVEQERAAVLRKISALKAAQTDLPLAASRDSSQQRRTIEDLKQQLAESEVKRELLIRAEGDGRVAGIVVDRGQTVAADQRMASLLPSGSVLEVELYAPPRAAGFVRPGTDVLLRYDAFPYQKFGQFKGTVREVSLNTIPLGEIQRGSAQVNGSGGGVASTEPVFRIKVALAPQQSPGVKPAVTIKPGMQLSATLVLEHRTIAEWIFEPLVGMAGAQ